MERGNRATIADHAEDDGRVLLEENGVAVEELENGEHGLIAKALEVCDRANALLLLTPVAHDLDEERHGVMAVLGDELFLQGVLFDVAVRREHRADHLAHLVLVLALFERRDFSPRQESLDEGCDPSAFGHGFYKKFVASFFAHGERFFRARVRFEDFSELLLCVLVAPFLEGANAIAEVCVCTLREDWSYAEPQAHERGHTGQRQPLRQPRNHAFLRRRVLRHSRPVLDALLPLRNTLAIPPTGSPKPGSQPSLVRTDSGSVVTRGVNGAASSTQMRHDAALRSHAPRIVCLDSTQYQASTRQNFQASSPRASSPWRFLRLAWPRRKGSRRSSERDCLLFQRSLD